MSEVVLDSSAVLAAVGNERGGEAVRPHMIGGVMSAVNYGEVLKKWVEHGGSAGLMAALLQRSQVRVVPFDADQARRTAELWPAVKSYGLSLGDRACLSLGISLGLDVLTADRRMAEPQLPVTVRVIR